MVESTLMTMGALGVDCHWGHFPIFRAMGIAADVNLPAGVR